MCLVNPDLDPEQVKSVAAAALKASTAGDIDSVIEYMRMGIKSEFLKLIIEHAKKIDEGKAAVLYSLAKGYVYTAYLQAMIKAAVEGITASPYRAGWYYPSAECCQALNAIKSAWLHFLATTNVPLRDAARAWLSAVTYEAPCRVSAATVAALRNMQSYITALALDASL
ncbi:MAG: hypothetical protein ACO2PN_11705 [Pyrobaculum sp.]|jgi:hypothetical protein